MSHDGSSLTIGVGAADITPTPGMPNAYHLNARIRNVVTPLRLQVCLLRCGGRQVAIVSADVCAWFGETIADMRRIVAETTGVSPSHVYANASHTHSGPYLHTAAQRLLGAHRLAFLDWRYYRSFLFAVRRASAEASEAARQAIPVSVRYAHVPVRELACNRRVKLPDGRIAARFGRNVPEELKRYPDGVIDAHAAVLWFIDDTGRTVCGLVNFACHATAFSQHAEVCWDYPGFARKRMEEAMQCPVLFLQGCAGNVSPGKYTGSDPLADAVRLGGRLAESILNQRGEGCSVPVPQLSARSETHWIGCAMKDSKEQLQRQFTEAVASWKHGSGSAGSAAAAQAGSMVSLAERLCIASAYPDRALPAEVGVIALGEARLVFLPGEMFVQAALAIKREWAGKPVLVMAYGDNTAQYIPDEAAFDEEGGYETGEMWCFCARGSLEQVAAKAVGMMRFYSP